jgi:flavin-binding protein dodecin
VEVLVRRKLAIVGGSSDAVYAELQKAQAKAEKAVEELNQLR